MIIVRVELLSAIDGTVTELARMHISNDGGDARHGDYTVKTLRGRDRAALNRLVVQRRGRATSPKAGRSTRPPSPSRNMPWPSGDGRNWPRSSTRCNIEGRSTTI